MKRPAAKKLRFALDHNFPAPVLAAFATILVAVELVPISVINPGWAELSDADLLIELDGAGWDGLVTNDDAMLSLGREMVVLSQTNLALVVAKGEGSNPVRAVGVLLCHLNHVCHQWANRPQIWRLSVTQKRDEAPRDYLETIAEKSGRTVEDLRREHAVRRVLDR